MQKETIDLGSPAVVLILVDQRLKSRMGMECRRTEPLDPGIVLLHMPDRWYQ